MLLGAGAYFDFDTYTYNADLYQQATNNAHPVTYVETGVSGGQALALYKPYNVYYLGADLTQRSLDGINMIGSPDLDLGSFAAVIGMPAMAGQVMSINLRPLAEPDLQLLNGAFSSTPPASTTGLTRHVAMTMQPPAYAAQPADRDPTDPWPTYAGVPLIANIGFSTTNVAGAAGSSTDTLLMDTGAQTSIISTATADRLHLNLDPNDPESDIVDRNNDGHITIEDYLEVGGIGGATYMPLVSISRMTLPTIEGDSLEMTDLVAGVLDIQGIDGVLGMNVLTSGYLDKILTDTTEYGTFAQVSMDFRDAANYVMALDINPDAILVPEPTLTVTLLAFGALLISRRRAHHAESGRTMVG